MIHSSFIICCFQSRCISRSSCFWADVRPNPLFLVQIHSDFQDCLVPPTPERLEFPRYKLLLLLDFPTTSLGFNFFKFAKSLRLFWCVFQLLKCCLCLFVLSLRVSALNPFLVTLVRVCEGTNVTVSSALIAKKSLLLFLFGLFCFWPGWWEVPGPGTMPDP